MNDFEQVLENCLDEIDKGASTVDDCLLRHPDHAAQLKPLLLTAARFSSGRDIHPSPAFKARTRAKLTLYMQANPRMRARRSFGFWRMASALAALTLAFLLTGTAYAQNALPGQLFYGWKRASESVWRVVSPNPVETDIAIANRRIEEMNLVSHDPLLRAQALDGYLEVVTRLKSEVDAETFDKIVPPQVKPESLIPTETPESSIPTQTPGKIQTPIVEPNSTSPPVIPGVPATSIPKILPTIEIPPPIQ